ncbi:unnamed protein product [Musa banksii]
MRSSGLKEIGAARQEIGCRSLPRRTSVEKERTMGKPEMRMRRRRRRREGSVRDK